MGTFKKTPKAKIKNSKEKSDGKSMRKKLTDGKGLGAIPAWTHEPVANTLLVTRRSEMYGKHKKAYLNACCISDFVTLKTNRKLFLAVKKKIIKDLFQDG